MVKNVCMYMEFTIINYRKIRERQDIKKHFTVFAFKLRKRYLL